MRFFSRITFIAIFMGLTACGALESNKESQSKSSSKNSESTDLRADSSGFSKAECLKMWSEKVQVLSNVNQLVWMHNYTSTQNNGNLRVEGESTIIEEFTEVNLERIVSTRTTANIRVRTFINDFLNDDLTEANSSTQAEITQDAFVGLCNNGVMEVSLNTGEFELNRNVISRVRNLTEIGTGLGMFSADFTKTTTATEFPDTESGGTILSNDLVEVWQSVEPDTRWILLKQYSITSNPTFQTISKYEIKSIE